MRPTPETLIDKMAKAYGLQVSKRSTHEQPEKQKTLHRTRKTFCIVIQTGIELVLPPENRLILLHQNYTKKA